MHEEQKGTGSGKISGGLPEEKGRPRRVAFTTLGCKLNQFETVAMQEQFKGEDFQIVPFDEQADIYVINTCTVTGKSDYRSRQAIRRAVRRNGNALVVAAGCYGQVDPDAVAKLEGVDLILGNTEKLRIMDHLDGLKKGEHPQVAVSDIQSCMEFQSISINSFPDYTRAFVKVQDGCDFRCAYCLVAVARGPSRSEAPEKVLQQARDLVKAGYRELVLTGVHLGSYRGGGDGEVDLAQLLLLLQEVEGLEKIRVSSIEPAEITDPLMEAMASSPKVCKHLHIPMQSGDDWILQRMGRNYDSSYYEALLLRLVDRMPDMGIGADVMVGFPGETDERFENTRSLIERLPLTYLHVFNFSPRKGTPAAEFSHQIDGETRKTRSVILRAMGKSKSARFRKKHQGKEATILVESTRDKETGLLKGLTDNYIQVFIDGGDELANRMVRVRLGETLNRGMRGEMTGG